MLYFAEHADHIFPDSDEVTITGTKTCPMCQSKVWLILPLEAVEAFLNGAFAQQAFPFMDANQRERFITGTCGTCWDTMFADPDDDI